MRLGFVHGISGDPVFLERALARLEGCDRIISLGNWVGGPRAAGAPPLAPPLLQPLLWADERIVLLSGPEERRLAGRANLPTGLRQALRALPSATIVGGIAVVGLDPKGTNGSCGSSKEARLVAPLAVYAHPTESRLWTQAGGFARIESIRGPMMTRLGDGRHRLDLGGGGADAGPSVAILDLAAGTLEIPTSLATGGGRAPRERRTSRVSPEQTRLAI